MKKLILLGIILLTTGCYNYLELNDIGIISAMAIDYKEDNYEITYEVLNTIKEPTQETPKCYSVTSTGSTITEAIQNNNNKLAKTPYFTHLEIVLITPSVNLLDVSDYILRNNDITTNFYLTLSDDPKSILSFNSLNNPINSQAIKNLLKKNNLDKLEEQFDFKIANLLDHKKDITIPSIKLDKEISLSTNGIYNYNNFIRYLTDEEQTTLQYLTNNNEFNLTNDKTSIKVKSSKTKFKENNNTLNIDTNIDALILSLNEIYNLKDNNTYNILEEQYTKTINNNITTLINNLKKDNSNILGFKNISEIEPNINIKIKIDKTGSLFEVAS